MKSQKRKAKEGEISAVLREVAESREEVLVNGALNALMLFSASSSPKTEFDLKRSAGQFQRALALLADERSFELADCLMDGWTGCLRDDGNPRQFVRAAATLGAAQLKNDEAAHWETTSTQAEGHHLAWVALYLPAKCTRGGVQDPSGSKRFN